MKKPLDIYARYFETLSSQNLRDLKMLVTEDVHFTDPLNDVTGAARMTQVFERMFAELESPRFKITDQAWGQSGKTGYMRWTLTYKRGGRPGKFEGMSEIRFNNDGKVMEHTNFWDSGSQFLQKIPVVGTVVRMIMNKASLGE